MSDQPSTSFDIQKFKALAETRLKELWSGSIPLFETFWIYYFAAIAVLYILAKAFGIVGIIFALAALCWAGFMVKPIWIAADKYPGPKHWAMIAKVFAILLGLSVVATIF